MLTIDPDNEKVLAILAARIARRAQAGQHRDHRGRGIGAGAYSIHEGLRERAAAAGGLCEAEPIVEPDSDRRAQVEPRRRPSAGVDAGMVAAPAAAESSARGPAPSASMRLAVAVGSRVDIKVTGSRLRVAAPNGEWWTWSVTRRCDLERTRSTSERWPTSSLALDEVDAKKRKFSSPAKIKLQRACIRSGRSSAVRGMEAGGR